MSEFTRLIAINLCVLAVLTLALEGVLTATHPVEALWNSEDFNAGWRWRDSPDRSQAPLLQYGIRAPQFWSTDEANQLGFRGRKIKYGKDDYVILLVGDSQVEAPAARFEQIPEIILERILSTRTGKQVRVFSIGASGWSQDQQFLALAEYFQRFRANLVVVWHTPANDYWENAFPDRSRLSANIGAGPLKPVFRLQPDGETIQLFQPKVEKQPLLARAVHNFNVGRGVLKILAALGIIDIQRLNPNNSVLQKWLHMIPPAGGHELVEKEQCPGDIVEQWMFSTYHSEYVGRSLTLETDEAVEESRGHLTPFLDPPSERDEYTMKITHILLREMKKLANSKGAAFLVFSYDFTFGGKSLYFGIKCAKKGDKFYRINSDFFRPIESWAGELNFQKLGIEIANYGLESVTVDLYDPLHLNFFGNKLVLQNLSERIASDGLPVAALGPANPSAR